MHGSNMDVFACEVSIFCTGRAHAHGRQQVAPYYKTGRIWELMKYSSALCNSMAKYFFFELSVIFVSSNKILQSDDILIFVLKKLNNSCYTTKLACTYFASQQMILIFICSRTIGTIKLWGITVLFGILFEIYKYQNPMRLEHYIWRSNFQKGTKEKDWGHGVTQGTAMLPITEKKILSTSTERALHLSCHGWARLK